jgi:hypothetical protein
MSNMEQGLLEGRTNMFAKSISDELLGGSKCSMVSKLLLDTFSHSNQMACAQHLKHSG